jgi:hypothetical protein
MVWEKPDIPTLDLIQPRQEIPRWHALMWGTLPPLILTLAALRLLLTAATRNFGAIAGEVRAVAQPRNTFGNPKLVRRIVTILALIGCLGFASLLTLVYLERNRPLAPENVIELYYDHLDFRRHPQAYALLDPQTRAKFDEVLFGWRWRGGLIASYGKLTSIQTEQIAATDTIIDWKVTLNWQTALDTSVEHVRLRTVKRDGFWYVTPSVLRPVQTPLRFQRQEEMALNSVGRRQPRPESDLHRDRLDRPELELSGARLVRYDGLYALVGQVTNIDADPAAVSLFGELMSGDARLVRQASGLVAGQRLLPSEVDGFRISFEGVLSLKASVASGRYDPKLFIPPELKSIPDAARLEGRAVVGDDGYYRGVALNGVTTTVQGREMVVAGLAVNTGTKTVSIARITATVFDELGRVVWVNAGFVDTNMYPGQSAPFSLTLPLREAIEIISEVENKDMMVNGTGVADASGGRTPTGALIALDGLGGYASMRLQVSNFTFDPIK